MNRRIAVFMALSFVFLLRTQVFASPLDEELQKLKQAGIPTTIEELNLPNIPDSENGAVVYKEAFKLIDNLVQKYRKEFEYMPYNGTVAGGWEKTPEEWKKKIADLILHNPDFSRVYQLLEKASGMKCRSYKKGVDYLGFSAQLRNAARMLAKKAKIEADYGDFNKSLTASLAGLKVAKSLSNEPSVVAQLTRMAMDSIALGELQKNINKKEAEPRLYLLLVKEMEAERKQNLSHFGFIGNYLEFWAPVNSNLRKIAGKSFEFTEEDKKELGKKWGNPSVNMMENEIQWRETYREAYLKSGCKNVDDFLKEQELFYLKILIKALPLLQKPYWETKEELKNIEVEIEKAPKEKTFLTYNSNLINVARTYNQEARIDAYLGAAELGLADRIYRQKHGKFADSLNQLTPEILSSLPLDPFTGKNYIYRLKDRGFIVYSVADNLKDDGGIPQFSEQGKRGDFDIVWEDNGAGYFDPLVSLPGGSRVKTLFQSLRDKTSECYAARQSGIDRTSVIPVFRISELGLGWFDIPDLMKMAESRRMLLCYPANSISSYILKEGYTEGTIALWLIECIREGSKFPSLNPLCFKRGEEGLYEGVEKKCEENHKAVYEAYRAWWEKVKDLPREKAVKSDPLKGTDLHWQ